jgi:phage shock protein A
MGIFSRVSDIMNANINSLLDKAEDPDKMVRLMILEMEETLVEVRSTSARVLADRKTLERRQVQLRELAQEWEHKAELAISKAREDLAKAALLEKHRVSDEADTIDAELGQFIEHLDKLGGDIEQLQGKLADAKARQKSLTMRVRSGRSRLDVRKQIHDAGTDDALARFEQYERRLDELEGQVEAYDLKGKGGLDEEFAALESDEKIEEELQAMKARIEKS